MLSLVLALVLQQVPPDDAPSVDVPSKTTAAADKQPAAAGGTPAPKQSSDVARDAGDGDGASEDSDESSAESDGLWNQVDEILSSGAIGLLRDGGFFMWPILLMAIIAAGVIMERYRSLRMLTTDTSQMREQVSQLLHEDHVEEAYAICEREHGPVPAILSAGLRKYLILRKLNYDPAKIDEQVVKGMDDYSVHIVAALERHLPILATISSVAPMLGFLGTVQGMIVAFKNIVDQMGETNIVEAAAAGIQVSLLTTCFGLIVGIPAFIAFNYFTSVINRFVLDVEESATELIENVTLQLAMAEKE
jgi:biopolymer transport protein ExbB